MSGVATKNPFDLLGDDGDSDNGSPVKTVDKKSTRTAKGNATGEAPAGRAPQPSVRRGAYGGNEAAYRDRGAGSDRNRGKTTDEARAAPRGGHNARVRGGRGSRHPRDRDDRHSKSAPSGGTGKEAAGGWANTEGEAELKDEQVGDEIAKKDENEANAENAEEAAKDETPAEPEDNSVSYADYLAQQAEKKLALDSENALKVRKANEGTKANKQWAAAKELVKEDEDFFMGGGGGKTKRERERKVKQVVELDNRYIEPERPRGGGRGGRGGDRGGPRGRGRGGDRGGFRGEHRGDYRGGRGGPRGGGQSGLNTKDESAFPSLGGS